MKSNETKWYLFGVEAAANFLEHSGWDSQFAPLAEGDRISDIVRFKFNRARKIRKSIGFSGRTARRKFRTLP